MYIDRIVKPSFAFFSTLVLIGCLTVEKPIISDDIFVFSSFRSNGQDGLHLAVSNDGLNWQALNNDKSVLSPQIGGKLMRDPCIILGPDNVFHMVWTTGWQDKGIGIAHSKDLVNWSEQQYLDVMAPFENARNAWAPELVWDAKQQQYLIFWASTLAGRYPATEKTADKGWDHRIYATSTKDFQRYSDTFLYYQPDFNVIDATISSFAEGYVMVIKDETRYPPAKNLKVARSSNLAGPWLLSDQAFTPKDLWVEGPTMLKIDQWFYVYFDAYTSHQYGVMRTRNFIDWENLSENLHMPEGTRHGSVFRVNKSSAKALLAYPQAESAESISL